jgi:hypothetical protein
MTMVRELPAQADHVMTAPLRFGRESPGLYIEGHDCTRYASALRRFLDQYNFTPSMQPTLWDLLADLEAPRVYR